MVQKLFMSHIRPIDIFDNNFLETRKILPQKINRGTNDWEKLCEMVYHTNNKSQCFCQKSRKKNF